MNLCRELVLYENVCMSRRSEISTINVFVD